MRVLRRMLIPEREEVIGGWRKLCKEELHNLYCASDIISEMRLVGYVARVGRLHMYKHAIPNT
jgi:hypothetical protein